ncbi:MAG: hypothetical protein ACOYJW_04770 [Candidatus Omnitrophota bacterium]|jgi:hypothetical protein
MAKALHPMGTFVNHKVIQKLVGEKEWLCHQKLLFAVKMTDSNHSCPIFPNRIEHLVVTPFNQVWAATQSL